MVNKLIKNKQDEKTSLLSENTLEQISREGMSELYGGGDGGSQINSGDTCSVIDNNEKCSTINTKKECLAINNNGICSAINTKSKCIIVNDNESCMITRYTGTLMPQP